MRSDFRVAVISDEITQDFDRGLSIIARDFGLEWVELRTLWNKNIMLLDAAEIASARALLEKYKLRVTDVASPLFKCDFRGAPPSNAPKDRFGADFTYEQQDEVLERALELCRAFNTDRLRGFDFWRIQDPAPFRAAMDAKLNEAAERAAKKGVILILENEHACNTATADEAVRTLNAVRSPNFKLNWDPGNAARIGDLPFPDGYKKLPKDRIGHVHCKDVLQKPGGERDWAPMNGGLVDWLGQFRALKRDGYRLAVSLETHWRGAGTPEESTRQSWAGMRELLIKAGAAS